MSHIHTSKRYDLMDLLSDTLKIHLSSITLNLRNIFLIFLLEHQEDTTSILLCPLQSCTYFSTFSLLTRRLGLYDRHCPNLIRSDMAVVLLPLIVFRNPYSPWILARFQMDGAQPKQVDAQYIYTFLHMHCQYLIIYLWAVVAVGPWSL